MAIMLRAAVYLILLLLTAKCITSTRVLHEQPAAPQTSKTAPPTDPGTEAVKPADAKSPTEAMASPPASLPPTEATMPIAPSMSPTEATMPPPPQAPSVMPTDAMTPPPQAPSVMPTDARTPPETISQPTSSPASPPALLTFCMHDILGGSKPSSRIVTGIVATTAAAGQIPLSKPNKDIPIQGATPLPDGVNNIINTDDIPYVAGLGGTKTTIVQNNGNPANGGSNALPSVNAAVLAAGSTLQNLLFGTTTVIDDELTEGHQIGSSVIGRAQGFYVASSKDGMSQTLVLTAMFEEGEYADTLSFFGVHHSAAPESHIAIIGGTGKYENAKGYAVIEILHPSDQNMTDGVETLLQFSVYLS